MSLKEIATSFAIGALLAGLAVGAYLWIDGMDEAHTIEPGSFTEVDGGMLIGAQAEAIDGPIEVQVEWVEASDQAGFDRLPSVDRAGRVAQVSVEGMDGGRLVAEPGSPFLLALPVPDDVESDRLTGASLLNAEHDPDEGETSGFWTRKAGVYDPEAGLFLTSVPILGDSAEPTRVAVVEHADQEARTLPGAVAAAEASLAGDETAPEPPATAGFSPQVLDGSRGSTTTDGLRFSSHTDTFQASVSGASGFTVLCEADPCPSSRKLAVHDGLEQGASKWEELAGTDGPALPEGTYEVQNSALEMDTYEWNLRDAGTQPECPGIYGAWGATGAFTCMDGGSWTQVDGATIGPLDATERVTAHELFHAYQYGYGAEDSDGLVSEGTARLTETVDTPLELSRVEWPPVVTDSLFEQSPYRAEYLFHHLFQNEGLPFEEFGNLFEEGLTVEALDTFVGKRTPHDGLGEAYWPFAKDLAYENQAPRIGPPPFLGDGGECELFEQPDPLPGGADMGSRSNQRDPIEIDERTVTIDTDTLEVDVGDGSNTIENSMAGLASDVYRFDYSPGATLDNGVWVTVRLEAPGSGEEPDMRLKLYDQEDAGTEACWDDGNEAQVGGSAGIEVWEGEEEAVLLVSNLEHDRSAGYELVFEACPMWSQEGQNPGMTYDVEGCGGSSDAPSSVQTMSSGPAAHGAIHLQGDDEPEPGSLLWSAPSDAISRPSAGYGNIYTTYGQGGLQDMLQGQGASETSIPDGRISAYDADTGERVWTADDSGAKMNIGLGSASSGFVSNAVAPVDSHEAILGGGYVFVPGGFMDDFYPPQENASRTEAQGSYGGVLAFDADDGSLAMEIEPPANSPPHEAAWVDRIALHGGQLIVKGGYSYFVDESHPYEDEPRWFSESEQTLWAFDVPGGTGQATWSSDLDHTKMTLGGGNAIVAGWTVPEDEEVAPESRLEVFDPSTGSIAWSVEGIVSPPPDPDLDVYTAGITEIVYEDGEVYIGTMVAGRDDVHGAVYAFGPGGQQWRYTTDEPMPDPAARDGTVYTLAGLPEDTGDGDSDTPGQASGGESTLTAIDAGRNQTRWAVNASMSMTVTEDRIYVGKGAPLTDPMGASVAALDADTGDTVWVNEEDVQGPMALTGAYVDDVLYVNTQASVVALNG